MHFSRKLLITLASFAKEVDGMFLAKINRRHMVILSSKILFDAFDGISDEVFDDYLTSI